MTDRQMREWLKKGDIAGQLILVSDEPLLVNNSIAAVKAALKLDESFDYDAFSAVEADPGEIVGKYYVAPFASARRLIVVRELENIETGELNRFAALLGEAPATNVMVMVYGLEKDTGARRNAAIYKKLEETFKKARVVTYEEEKGKVAGWIATKAKKKDLNLSGEIVKYLAEEFANDITGLKNEFEKIENYLYEAKHMGVDDARDLASGLCNLNKYRMVSAFFKGQPDILDQFEELKPYIHSYAEITDALVRNALYAGTRPSNSGTGLEQIVEQVRVIDRKIKSSSYFTDLYIEIFFLNNSSRYSPGRPHGK